MKNSLVMAAALVATVAIPAVSFAATYQYVNVNGMLSVEQAASTAAAMLVSDIAPHSGVILVNAADGMTGVSGSGSNTVVTGGNTVMTTGSNQIIMNADGSISVVIPAGTHIHSDSDTSATSNSGSCNPNQVITTSNDVEQTSSTTATGSSEHFTHTSTTNC